MGRSPHEAGGGFDVAAKLGADWGKGKGLIEGCALSKLPLTRSGSNERNVYNLEIGCRCGRFGFDGNKAGDRDEAAYMLENTGNVRRGRDSGCGNEHAGTAIKSGLENDVGVNILPKVRVNLPDKFRDDGVGTDGRSGRWH
jgi:hypothetical protein